MFRVIDKQLYIFVPIAVIAGIAAVMILIILLVIAGFVYKKIIKPWREKVKKVVLIYIVQIFLLFSKLLNLFKINRKATTAKKSYNFTTSSTLMLNF